MGSEGVETPGTVSLPEQLEEEGREMPPRGRRKSGQVF